MSAHRSGALGRVGDVTLADLLRQRRESLGLTLQEVGDAAGVTKGHLHDPEHGRHDNPGLFTCTRLAVALGLTVQVMASALIESRLSRFRNS